MRRSRAPPTVAPVWKMFRRKVPIFYKLPPHAADQMRWFLCFFMFVFFDFYIVLLLHFSIFVLSDFCILIFFCMLVFLHCCILIFFFAFSCFFCTPMLRIRWENDRNCTWICHCNFCLVVCNRMIWKIWLYPKVYQQGKV